eukprot:11190130-Heterocapsa_arctica.AAC.1
MAASLGRRNGGVRSGSSAAPPCAVPLRAAPRERRRCSPARQCCSSRFDEHNATACHATPLRHRPGHAHPGSRA